MGRVGGGETHPRAHIRRQNFRRGSDRLTRHGYHPSISTGALAGAMGELHEWDTGKPPQKGTPTETRMNNNKKRSTIVEEDRGVVGKGRG